jgi:hypothetical protein
VGNSGEMGFMSHANDVISVAYVELVLVSLSRGSVYFQPMPQKRATMSNVPGSNCANSRGLHREKPIQKRYKCYSCGVYLHPFALSCSMQIDEEGGITCLLGEGCNKNVAQQVTVDPTFPDYSHLETPPMKPFSFENLEVARAFHRGESRESYWHLNLDVCLSIVVVCLSSGVGAARKEII